MNTVIFILLYIVGAVALAYYRASLKTATIASASLFFLYILFGSKIIFITIVLLVITAIFGILSLRDFRKTTISRLIFKWYKRVLPPLSATEQGAIETGTVWWEGELFTGNLSGKNYYQTEHPSSVELNRRFSMVRLKNCVKWWIPGR